MNKTWILLLDSLWSSMITPKGPWELFIQWVVWAIKFDWFTYVPAVMFIPLASSPLHSPSRKWVIWGVGLGGVVQAILREQAVTVYSLPIKAEKIAYSPCDPADRSAPRPHVKYSGLLVVAAKSKSFFSTLPFQVWCLLPGSLALWVWKRDTSFTFSCPLEFHIWAS